MARRLIILLILCCCSAWTPGRAACGDPPQLLNTLPGTDVFDVALGQLYSVYQAPCPGIPSIQCVRVTTLTGQFVLDFPTASAGGYRDIEVLDDGTVFLQTNSGVERYSSSGLFTGVINDPDLGSPRGMDVGPGDVLQIWALSGSPSGAEVRWYDSNGANLLSYAVDAASDDHFAADVAGDGHIARGLFGNAIDMVRYDSAGAEQERIRISDRQSIDGLDVDASGRFLFSLGSGFPVRLYNRGGLLVWEFGQTSGRVVVADDGIVYVSTLDSVVEVWSALDPDLDGDGLADCIDPEPTAPDYDLDGVSAGGDCDDLNPNCALDCTDEDLDGYCVDQDCDDLSEACAAACIDEDGDGVPVCEGDCDDNVAGCVLDCTDADGDGVAACAGDCDDQRALCITDCEVDADGDGEPACSDCDDLNPFCGQDCVDGDGDGLCRFDDCDDTDSACGQFCGGECGDFCEFEDSSYDWDSDGVPDCRDNCPVVANAMQADADQDGVGDLCDCQVSITTGEDGDDGEFEVDVSLREAIAFAQNGCSIRVPPGNYDLDPGLGPVLVTGSKALLGAGKESTRIRNGMLRGVGAAPSGIFLGGLGIEGGLELRELGPFVLDSAEVAGVDVVEPDLYVQDSVLYGAEVGLDVGSGTVRVSRSVIRDNQVGARVNSGPLEAVDTTFLRNGVGVRGAGGAALLERSTVRSSSECGIYTFSGSIELRNSTVTENHGLGLAGGIHINNPFPVVTISNSTIYANTSDGVEVGGIGGSDVDVLMANSILAANGNGDCEVNLDGAFSLVQDTTGCNLIGDGSTMLLGVDPQLGALGGNGGDTLSYKPLMNSPVVDAGSPEGFESTATSCRQFDQIKSRRIAFGCDMGSVESDSACSDFDGDGFGGSPPCDPLDCDESNDRNYPGAPEVNDGVDNNCPGDRDYGLIDENTGPSGYFDPANRDAYSWPPQELATSYEAVRADSADMVAGCTPMVSGDVLGFVDPAMPVPGAVFFYLDRPLTPNAGSFGHSPRGGDRMVPCAGTCVDGDGDGTCVAADCDDSNPACSFDCSGC
ncbi:hypothetical protein ABI59_21115 [Acidobacteria bacterium Mor1]|nr:hypothetical protein ABI59_21115 [Acidobacteria bacterium Mor1]